MSWVDDAPLWAIGVTLAVGMVLVEELGFRVRRAVSLRWEPPEEGPGVGYLISAALALLGLLIAFTFSMAAAHHDLRTGAVADEANAVSAAYLRYQLLEEPARGELGRLTLEYLDLRLRAVEAAGEPARAVELAEQAARTQERIWTALAPVARGPNAAVLTTPLLNATNEMFAAGADRRAATETRVPTVIVRTVVLYAFLCALFMGYGLASGGRHFVASTALFVLIALTVTLVIDIDRPRPGAVRVDEGPLLRVTERVRRMEATRTAPPAPAEPAVTSSP